MITNAKTIVYLCVLSIFIFSPAYGFKKYGKVCDELSFSKIKIYQPNSYFMKVCGYIRNKTDYKIFLSANLILHRITKTVINQASIVENLEPNSSIYFDVYLQNDDNYKDTREALHLKWVVNDLQVHKPYEEPEYTPKMEAMKNIDGDSIVREGKASIFITGNGQNNTDKFVLETGNHLIKTSHDGQRNFIVRLKNEYGHSEKLLINKIGRYLNKRKLYIHNPGNYYFDVDADGEWEFEIERPRRILNDDPLRPVETDLKPSKWKVETTDGRIINADNFSNQGSQVIIELYGAQIFFEKEKIKKISKIPIK